MECHIREKHGLRVSENRMPRTSGPKEEEDGSFIICIIHQTLFITIKSRTGWAGHEATMDEKCIRSLITRLLSSVSILG
jgi:hypothetical protein